MSDINSILVEGVPNEPAVETPVVEMVSAEPVPVTEVVEPTTLPATPTEQVLSLSGEVAKTLHDVLTYIHEGFDQHSIMIGMSRLCEISRLVKAEVEA